MYNHTCTLPGNKQQSYHKQDKQLHLEVNTNDRYGVQTALYFGNGTGHRSQIRSNVSSSVLLFRENLT